MIGYKEYYNNHRWKTSETPSETSETMPPKTPLKHSYPHSHPILWDKFLKR